MKRDLLQLARAGAILWTEPNQQVKTEDLFRPDATPYQALVTWREGTMQDGRRLPRFEAAISSAFRLRNSVLAEVLLIAIVYAPLLQRVKLAGLAETPTCAG